jgi:hypothetical protein
MKKHSTYDKKFDIVWKKFKDHELFFKATKAAAQYWYSVGWKAYQSAHQEEIEKAYKKLRSPLEMAEKGTNK